MAQQTIDDTSLTEALFDVFRSRGYEGATLSLLSKATGLKKSSFYHRFPAGKDDMVKAVVLYVSKQLHDHIITPLLMDDESAEKRFRTMINSINTFYNDGRKNCILNVLNLGDTKTEIKEILNKDYNDWLSAIIKIGEEIGLTRQEAETKSKHFLIAVEGSLVIQRVTNDSDTFKSNLTYEQKLFFT